jgi:iron complex outermembrane recepter protein
MVRELIVRRGIDAGCRSLLGLLLACALLACVPGESFAVAAGSVVVEHYDIDKAPADQALIELAQQTRSRKLTVLVLAENLARVTTGDIHGSYRPEEALDILLANTGLAGSISAAGVVTVTTTRQNGEAMTDKKVHAGWMGGLVALLSAHAVTAQEAGTTAADDQGGIQEVVITAERVSEDIEKTPLAVTAITGAQIAAEGAFTATDLSTLVPNFTASPNGPGSTIAIRGVVSTAQTLTGATEVSYSQDGVTLIQKIGAFQGMYDVSRVEVLRGPQGTLYGANATAGAINVITNKPDLSADSATGSVGFGNYGAMSASGALNMPLTDTFGVRVALDHDTHDGYIKLAHNAARFDDEDFTGGRVHMLWKPSENFSALFTYEQSHDGGSGAGGAGSGAPLGLYMSQQGVSPYSYDAMPGRLAQDWTVRSSTLTLDWSLPSFDVAFVSNVRWQDWVQSVPETIYGPEAGYCQNITNPSQCFNPIIVHDNDRQDSDELRLSGKFGRVDWLGAVYHVRDNVFFNIQFDPAPFNPAIWAKLWSDYTERADAAYGQLKWNITDDLNLVGGIRYQRDVKSMPRGGFDSADPGNIVGDSCIDCTQFASFSGQGSWNKFQWHAGLNYNLNPDSFLFASVATGYTSGGFSQGATEPFNPTYGPENLTNYEIGWKNQLFDNRAQINLDAFFMNYTGYQVTSSIIDAQGNYLTVVLNAGKAQIKGLELESTWLLTQADKLTLTATALQAKFTDFYLPLGDGYVTDPSGIAPTDYTGNQLPNAPHATARLGYEHTFPLSGTDSLTAHGDTSWSGSYYLDYHNYSSTWQDSYFRSNAWVTWDHKTPSNHTFSTQLYVRNIENKAVLAGGQADGSAPGNPAAPAGSPASIHDFDAYGKNGYYLAPRTFGIRFNVAL